MTERDDLPRGLQLEPVTDPVLIQRLSKVLRKAEARTRWIGRHWQELLRDYNEQFVAIHYRGRVVAASKDLPGLVEEVKQRRFNLRENLEVKFITDQYNYILLQTTPHSNLKSLV